MNISISTDSEDVLGFRALAGSFAGTGKTPGEALDSIAMQMDPGDIKLIVVQGIGGDQFFTVEQHERLSKLKQLFRDARDLGGSLPQDVQSELNLLIDAELKATIQRIEDFKRRAAS